MDKELSAGATLSHYRIISKIGAGGMGEVYLAQDTKLDRKVALKILPADVAANQQRMRRFVQEARAASALNHPNILTIYEIDETDSGHFIAAEFIDGETLRERIDAGMNLSEILETAIEVGGALAAAHAAGIIHRDIKPENIMVRRDGYVKVLDFGLAKLTESPESATDPEAATRARVNTGAGTVMGTANYMSPEQAKGTDVDARTDLWSLGAVLYEMIAGHVPFRGETPTETISLILQREPAPLKRLMTDVPAELERIVTKALAKNREERYQTAKDLLIDLRNLKRKMEVDAEIERTGAPDMAAAVSTSTGQSARVTAPGALPATASSAEYVVSGIKQHKLAVALAFLVLAIVVGGALVLSRYRHARDTEAAIDSIAVLFFENQNRDPNIDYLSEGVTESIMNNLAQLPNLRVSPRSSVLRYRGREIDALAIGKELGVRAVLTGRLLQRGDNLTISTELLDVRDNKQVWGEQYNRKLADALAVQQEISREITDRLRLKLSGEEQKQLTRRDARNPEAYQLYLKGRYYWNKRTADNIKKAMDQFQQATDRDPNYALAYVGLADCYLVLEEYAGTPASETLPKAKAFAQRALELDGALAEAHTSLAYANHFLWRWDEAETGFQQAIRLNPNYPTAHHWYSLYLRDVGRFDESMTEIKRAHELDPISGIIGVNLAQVHFFKGDVNSSIEQSKRVLDLNPNYARGHSQLGLGYLKQGHYSEAIEEFQKAVNLSSVDRGAIRNLSYGYAIAGKRPEALRILKEIQGKYERHEAVAADVAAVYAALEDKDQAFVWLERDFQARSGRLARIIWEPYFESLRSDPRYADLRRRMGLKP